MQAVHLHQQRFLYSFPLMLMRRVSFVSDSISKILIVRLSAMGDVVMASPLIHALRQRYPNAWIAWLVQPENAALLESHPELDEVIIWPRRQWEELWRQRRFWQLFRVIAQFRRELRSRNFDLALDVHSLLKSGIMVWLSGARRRIGLGSREGSALLMTEVVPKPADDIRISSEYRHLAEHLGLPNDPFPMHVAIAEEDRVAAVDLLQARGLEPGRFAVICPFTTRPQKHWLADRWNELAECIHERWQWPVVVMGGPGDVAAAEELTKSSSSIISLAGKTRLGEAAAVIAKARVLAGVDTGLTHMGVALNVPSVILFGSTCPYLQTGYPRTRVIYHRQPCSPCRRRPTCNGAYTCMREIRVEEVLRHMDEVLA